MVVETPHDLRYARLAPPHDLWAEVEAWLNENRYEGVRHEGDQGQRT
jgi:hypothetical protein